MSLISILEKSFYNSIIISIIYNLNFREEFLYFYNNYIINYIINNYDNVCLISILVNVIKIKRDFLYIEHMDKECHDQGILVDLHRLYTLVTRITAMITSSNCFYTPKTFSLSASQQKRV